MSNWPFDLGGAGPIDRLYSPVTASSLPVSITTGGTAHVKTAWTELVASTENEYEQLLLTAYRNDTTFDHSFLLDIAIGAASSEQAIAENLFLSFRDTFGGTPGQIVLPISVPAGVRLSARVQCDDTNETVYFALHGVCGFPFGKRIGHSLVDTMGANTSTTRGVNVDPGGTANTKGSWAEIASSTANDYSGLLFLFAAEDSASDSDLLLDVGVGAASSEQVVIADHGLYIDSGTDLCENQVLYWHSTLPAGSRLAARVQSPVTSGVTLDVVAYGFAA